MTVTKKRSRATAVALALALTVGVGGGVAVVTTVPAGAEIAGVSPSVRDVDPGGSASATVTVTAGGFTCLSGTPSRADLQPTFSTTCSDADRWTSTLSVQVPNEPGTYSVRVRDDNFGGREGTFTIRVREPSPQTTTTTPTSTTPTTGPPTSTSTSTTTAVASTTSAVAETTTSTTRSDASTTTTLPTPAPGDPFTPVAQLAQDPLPAEGIFLPLTGRDFDSCLPLTKPCSDDGTGLVLVPARTSEIAWQSIDVADLPARPSDLRGLPPIPAVGVGPTAPREQNYVLTMLDLSTPVAALQTLVRSVDAKGEFSLALGTASTFGAVAAGPGTAVRAGATAAPNPFGRPAIVRASTLSEAAPVIPLYAAPTPQVLYALRPDVSWGVNAEVIPLVGKSLPYLARAVDGRPGLFFARPTGLLLPATAPGAGTTQPAPTSGGGGGGFPLPLVLLGVVVLAVGALGLVALTRRGRSRDDEKGPHGIPAPASAGIAAAPAARVAAVVPAPIPVPPDAEDVEDDVEDEHEDDTELAGEVHEADVDDADDVDEADVDDVDDETQPQSEEDELAALIAAASAAAGNSNDGYDDDGVATYDVDIDDEPSDPGPRPRGPVAYLELRADPAYGRADGRDDILPRIANDDDDD